jgi:hypothetical protein
MSRARPAGERIPLDSYQTPPDLAVAICDRLFHTDVAPLEILEPSAGKGAFVRAARARWPDAHVSAVEVNSAHLVELDAAGAQVILIDDWASLARGLAAEQADSGPERLVLGNPPFRQAQEHVEAALEWMREGDHLAFLLRLGFLGSAARVAFWRRPGLVSVAPIAPRPSFTGGGTDGAEYAVFVWRKGYRGAPTLQRPLTWSGKVR